MSCEFGQYIFIVKRPESAVGHDQYDSFVCVAANADHARDELPCECDADCECGAWPIGDDETLEVTCIGVAAIDQNPGIVHRSFNAG